MKYQAEDAVSSFFCHIWSAWSKEGCKVAFGDMYRHFWDRWSVPADSAIFGATKQFFAGLSESYRRLLAKRVITFYDGEAPRKEPDDSDILAYKGYGLRQLEIQVWINADTDKRISYIYDSNDEHWYDGKWCEECTGRIFFYTKAEFTREIWPQWESCGPEPKEQITGLKVCDYSPAESPQTLVNAADR